MTYELAYAAAELDRDMIHDSYIGSGDECVFLFSADGEVLARYPYQDRS